MRTTKSIMLSPRKKKLLYTLIAVAFIGLAIYGIRSVVNMKGNLNSQQIKIQHRDAEVHKLNQEVEKKTQEHQQKDAEYQQKGAEYQQKIQKLEEENKDLGQQLQAKIEQKRRLAEAARKVINVATGTAVASAQSVSPSARAIPAGSHQDWMASAGISPSDYGYVEYIVSKESGWNPNSVNSSSGACGLGQQLPCGKWAGAWNDPIAALVAMQGYAIVRYGSWASAYNFWLANNWW